MTFTASTFQKVIFYTLLGMFFSTSGQLFLADQNLLTVIATKPKTTSLKAPARKAQQPRRHKPSFLKRAQKFVLRHKPEFITAGIIATIATTALVLACKSNISTLPSRLKPLFTEPEIDWTIAQRASEPSGPPTGTIEVGYAQTNDIPALLALHQWVTREWTIPQVVQPKISMQQNDNYINARNYYTYYKHYHDHPAKPIPANYYEKRFGLAVHKKENWRLLVAKNDAGQPIGLLLFNFGQSRKPNVDHSTTGRLHYLIVHKTARSKVDEHGNRTGFGVGKRLVTEALQECLINHPKITRWEVNVKRHYNKDARRFYKKIGFSKIKPDFLPGTQAEELWYELIPEELQKRYVPPKSDSQKSPA